jgi:hypothetical protein
MGFAAVLAALELANVKPKSALAYGKPSVQLTENKAETGTLPGRPRPFGNDLFSVQDFLL